MVIVQELAAAHDEAVANQRNVLAAHQVELAAQNAEYEGLLQTLGQEAQAEGESARA